VAVAMSTAISEVDVDGDSMVEMEKFFLILQTISGLR
jgi:hypothetical protein